MAVVLVIAVATRQAGVAVLNQCGAAAVVDDLGAQATAYAGSRPQTLPGPVTVPGARPGTTMTLTGEQVSNAAVVIFEGKTHRLPAYGWVVALAAALQESGIRNLGYGDRDSEGIFQQRPSAGWGTSAQIRNPHLAAQAFYGVAAHTHNRGLVDIPGWQQLSVADAAQAVQRSAFPSAYAKWEAAARNLVQRLGGTVAAGEDLSVSQACPDASGAGDGQLGSCPASGLPAEHGLTPDALRVLRCAKAAFPAIETVYGVGDRPANTDDDHQTGRAVDLMIPDHRTPAGVALGWQIARWMRDHHAQLGVHYVIWAARIWNIDRDSEGWRNYASITGRNDDTSLHYDHVHVSVFGTRGTGLPPTERPPLSAGEWSMPLPPGNYRVGCGFGCYAGHTGQDFPVPAGTPVASTDSGTVIRSEALRRGGRYVSYGNLIVIRDTRNPAMKVYYAHLSQRDVRVGQTIRAGQIIGRSGYTGHVIPAGPRGAHLHYEIRIDGTPVDPIRILADHGVHP
ncbi:hypothetical protein GCM10022236_13060 [Microlunatus ginsengisoli]|uniref:Peptidoglycan DD-metalloendopeptidase family protein n=1 Tax=Microlunatus ginsengisoli TaxID=363863 RepID=A0ABP6ZPE2_9ACTN